MMVASGRFLADQLQQVNEQLGKCTAQMEELRRLCDQLANAGTRVVNRIGVDAAAVSFRVALANYLKTP